LVKVLEEYKGGFKMFLLEFVADVAGTLWFALVDGVRRITSFFSRYFPRFA